jgi:hypothetical protein
MPWTTPGTAVADDVLTASFWNSNVRDNMLMGNPVFTNEAARDAVITSPVEGQRAYLTAPTVPATSGGSTSILPSGIQTIYNGSVWVCTTPISVQQTGLSSSITSTTFTNALFSGNPLTVTLVTGAAAMVHLNCRIVAAGNFYFVGVKSATVAATDQQSFTLGNVTQTSSGTSSYVMYNLTAGTNTFTVQMRSNAGAFTIDQVNLTVEGVA